MEAKATSAPVSLSPTIRPPSARRSATSSKIERIVTGASARCSRSSCRARFVPIFPSRSMIGIIRAWRLLTRWPQKRAAILGSLTRCCQMIRRAGGPSSST
jgi:hypothetical protein